MPARDPFHMRRFCRGCGCTERNACVVETPRGPMGCWWILLDIDEPSGICAACALELAWDQDEFINIGCAVPPELRFGLVRA